MTFEQFNEILEQFQATDPNTLLEALKEVEQASIDAAAETRQASDAYYANAREKEEKVNNRIASLIKQRDGYQAKIEAFKKPLVAATVAGDSKKLDSIKSGMKELEADKLQVSTEIEMLQSTHMCGDAELYNDVIAKHEHFRKLLDAYWQARASVHVFAGSREDTYNKINDKTGGRYGGGHGPDMEKLDRHYHAEEWAKINAKDAEETAARKAAEANRPRNLHTNTYRFGEFPDSL